MKKRWDDTTSLETHWQDRTFDGRRRRRGAKRHVLQRLVGLSVTGCCLALAIAAFAANAVGPRQDADRPPYGQVADGDEQAWCLILVNRWNPIPEDYRVDLTKLAGGESVDARIAPALLAMLEAAEREGVYPVVVSGYRTEKVQQRLLDQKIAQYRAEGQSDVEALVGAQAWVAPPGASEHQVGLAVDINADGVRSTGEEVYAWLEANSHKFGFIRRYPADKTEITGVIHEPWHYRYVGVAAAADIVDQGLCLEEYLDALYDRAA